MSDEDIFRLIDSVIINNKIKYPELINHPCYDDYTY